MQVMVGIYLQQNEYFSVFQIFGAEMQKLRGPYVIVFVLCLTDHRSLRNRFHWASDVTKVHGTCTANTVECHDCDLVLDTLGNGQPV